MKNCCKCTCVYQYSSSRKLVGNRQNPICTDRESSNIHLQQEQRDWAIISFNMMGTCHNRIQRVNHHGQHLQQMVQLNKHCSNNWSLLTRTLTLYRRFLFKLCRSTILTTIGILSIVNSNIHPWFTAASSLSSSSLSASVKWGLLGSITIGTSQKHIMIFLCQLLLLHCEDAHHHGWSPLSPSQRTNLLDWTFFFTKCKILRTHRLNPKLQASLLFSWKIVLLSLCMSGMISLPLRKDHIPCSHAAYPLPPQILFSCCGLLHASLPQY